MHFGSRQPAQRVAVEVGLSQMSLSGASHSHQTFKNGKKRPRSHSPDSSRKRLRPQSPLSASSGQLVLHTNEKRSTDVGRPDGLQHGKLTDAEKDRRRREGLCGYCASPDHDINHCPTCPKTDSRDRSKNWKTLRRGARH